MIKINKFLEGKNITINTINNRPITGKVIIVDEYWIQLDIYPKLFTSNHESIYFVPISSIEYIKLINIERKNSNNSDLLENIP